MAHERRTFPGDLNPPPKVNVPTPPRSRPAPTPPRGPSRGATAELPEVSILDQQTQPAATFRVSAFPDGSRRLYMEDAFGVTTDLGPVTEGSDDVLNSVSEFNESLGSWEGIPKPVADAIRGNNSDFFDFVARKFP